MKTCKDCPKQIHDVSDRCLKCAAADREGKGTGIGHRSRGTGRHVEPSGYATLSGHKDHPNCMSNGRIFEHTYIMSQMIGRPLVKGESVHHKNMIRDDNRPSNLELWNKRQPTGHRVEDMVEFCKQYLADYEETYEKLRREWDYDLWN